jgi:hypothetical protein
MGGSDDKSNLVELLAEEHFVGHLLLARIHPENRKLVFAANMMLMNSPMHHGARSRNKRHAWLRKAHAEAARATHLGVPKSPEHVAKVSRALTGKPGTRRGAVTAEETKAKQSAAAFARPDKAENDEKMREGYARMTPQERTAQAGKAWDTKRANGKDRDTPETRAKKSTAGRERSQRETSEEKTARALKAAESRRRNGSDKATPESRERMRQAHLGKKQSLETVAKRKATIARNKALKAVTMPENT